MLVRVGEGHPRSVTLPTIGTVRVHDDTRRLRRLLRPVAHLDPATGQSVVAPRAICSKCGMAKQQMGLAERIFICAGCGLASDRDRNAAGGEGAGHRLGDGETNLGEGGTDAHAVMA